MNHNFFHSTDRYNFVSHPCFIYMYIYIRIYVNCQCYEFMILTPINTNGTNTRPPWMGSPRTVIACIVISTLERVRPWQPTRISFASVDSESKYNFLAILILGITLNFFFFVYKLRWSGRCLIRDFIFVRIFIYRVMKKQ